MNLDLQLACEGHPIPEQQQFLAWAKAALVKPIGDEELTIRVVDTGECQTLNRDYRSQDKPTNVLSFPADLPDEVEVNLLGDIIICAPVVATEADQQNKAVNDHWAHMIVHGVLHLQGYDHIDTAQAEIMEQLEIDILARHGVGNPYLTAD